MPPQPTAQDLYRLEDALRSRPARVHVLLYSVTDRSSFDAITPDCLLLQMCRHNTTKSPAAASTSASASAAAAAAASKQPPPVIYLVANKTDLRSTSASTSASTTACVTRAEGLLKAKALGLTYLECAALPDVLSVVEVMRRIVYGDVERWQQLEEQWAKAHS